jgi:hypothetical protein
MNQGPPRDETAVINVKLGMESYHKVLISTVCTNYKFGDQAEL